MVALMLLLILHGNFRFLDTQMIFQQMLNQNITLHKSLLTNVTIKANFIFLIPDQFVSCQCIEIFEGFVANLALEFHLQVIHKVMHLKKESMFKYLGEKADFGKKWKEIKMDYRQIFKPQMTQLTFRIVGIHVFFVTIFIMITYVNLGLFGCGL